MDHAQGECFGHIDAVHRCRQNPARITGAFTGREEAARVKALAFAIAWDAEGRGGARFDASQDRIVHRKAADLLVEGRDGFAQAVDDIGRHAARQIGHVHAGLVRRIDLTQLGGRPAGKKIADALGRRLVGAAAGCESHRGPMALKIEADQGISTEVVAGDRNAFGVLIQRYSDPLYRHALGMTGSPDVAEDILQMSFIKAFQHLSEVRGRFDAWVFRIVANGCKDWLKNIRRTHLSYEEDDQPTSYATPEEELDRTQLRNDLDVALAQLPTSLREAFIMKHVEGRSYEEMADLLGTTVGALKMRVHRAREALQALLEEKYA